MAGLAYYIRVDWNKLLEGTTWIDGATQIFFAYSIGMGSLPALGSYNKFNHNCVRDSFITCVVNTLTCLLAGVLVFSILGYMAHIQDTTIHDVVNSGPGLVYLTYPDLVQTNQLFRNPNNLLHRSCLSLALHSGPSSSL